MAPRSKKSAQLFEVSLYYFYLSTITEGRTGRRHPVKPREPQICANETQGRGPERPAGFFTDVGGDTFKSREDRRLRT